MLMKEGINGRYMDFTALRKNFFDIIILNNNAFLDYPTVFIRSIDRYNPKHINNTENVLAQPN